MLCSYNAISSSWVKSQMAHYSQHGPLLLDQSPVHCVGNRVPFGTHRDILFTLFTFCFIPVLRNFHILRAFPLVLSSTEFPLPLRNSDPHERLTGLTAPSWSAVVGRGVTRSVLFLSRSVSSARGGEAIPMSCTKPCSSSVLSAELSVDILHALPL